MKSRFELPILSSPQKSHRGITRREMLQRVLAGLGTTLAAPLAAAAHPMARHLADPSFLQGAAASTSGADWSPQFLNAKQNEALVAISERVLPGANNVQVNRVIDLLLSVDTVENQKMFASALNAFGTESTRRFHQEAAALSATQLDELLTACSTVEPAHSEHDDSADDWKLNRKTPATAPPNLRDHFENLKGWIVATYYSSEVGLRELGWNDDFYFESPPECVHPQGHP
jgi:hypothetical protein